MVAADAYSANGTVSPSRNAAFECPMLATKSGLPVGRSKDILDALMVTVKPLCRVRNKTDNRLLRKSGTCSTLENSTGLTCTPLTIGLNTTVPSPAE